MINLKTHPTFGIIWDQKKIIAKRLYSFKIRCTHDIPEISESKNYGTLVIHTWNKKIKRKISFKKRITVYNYAKLIFKIREFSKLRP